MDLGGRADARLQRQGTSRGARGVRPVRQLPLRRTLDRAAPPRRGGELRPAGSSVRASRRTAGPSSSPATGATGPRRAGQSLGVRGAGDGASPRPGTGCATCTRCLPRRSTCARRAPRHAEAPQRPLQRMVERGAGRTRASGDVRLARPSRGGCMQRKENGRRSPEALSRRRLLQLGVAGAALLGGERARGAPPEGPTADAGAVGLARRGHGRRAPGADGEGRGDQPLHHPEVPGPDRAAGRPGALGAGDQPRRAGQRGRARRASGRAGKVRGPLHGIPVLLKDNIATADRMHDHRRLARAGGGDGRRADAFLVGPPARGRRRAPRQDQPQRVGQLPLQPLQRAAGAAAAASAATPTRSTAAPRGSSSGSGVAVAASLCAVAVGTETDGSIVSPVGRLGAGRGEADRRPGEPRAASSPSRTARTPPDRWRGRCATRRCCWRCWRARTRATRPPRRDGARFDVRLRRGAGPGRAEGRAHRRRPAKYFGYHPATDALAEEALEVLKARGGGAGRPRDPSPPRRSSTTPELEVLLFEFKAGPRGLPLEARRPAVRATLKDADRVQPGARRRASCRYFGQELFLDAREEGAADHAGVPEGPRRVRPALARARASTR